MKLGVKGSLKEETPGKGVQKQRRKTRLVTKPEGSWPKSNIAEGLKKPKNER